MSKVARAPPAMSKKDPGTEKLEELQKATNRSVEDCQEALRMSGGNASKAADMLLDSEKFISPWRSTGKRDVKPKKDAPGAGAAGFRPPRTDRPERAGGRGGGRGDREGGRGGRGDRGDRDRDGFRGERRPQAAAAAPAKPAAAPEAEGGRVALNVAARSATDTPWNRIAAAHRAAQAAAQPEPQPEAAPAPSSAPAPPTPPPAAAPVEEPSEPTPAPPAPIEEPVAAAAEPVAQPAGYGGIPDSAAAAEADAVVAEADPLDTQAWDWGGQRDQLAQLQSTELDYSIMGAGAHTAQAGAAVAFAPRVARTVIFTTRNGIEREDSFVMCKAPEVAPQPAPTAPQSQQQSMMPPQPPAMPHQHGFHPAWGGDPYWGSGAMYREDYYGDQYADYGRRQGYGKEQQPHGGHSGGRPDQQQRPKGGRGRGGYERGGPGYYPPYAAPHPSQGWGGAASHPDYYYAPTHYPQHGGGAADWNNPPDERSRTGAKPSGSTGYFGN